MSRVDRMVARRQEAPRLIRPEQKPRPVLDRTTGKIEYKRLPHHIQGDRWWRVHLADLVERRVVEVRSSGHSEVTYEPRPKRKRAPAPPKVTERPAMVPRPEGMSRQVQRVLYRKACKSAGVPWRASSPPKGT